MKRAAVACALLLSSCGPSSDGPGSHHDGGGTGGNACVMAPPDTDGDNISDADEGANEKPPNGVS